MNNLKKFEISKEKQKTVKGGNIPVDLYGKCPVGYCASHIDKGTCVQMTKANPCEDMLPN